MLDWLIIGGGVHGTFLSHALVHRAGAARERVRVLDPNATPLETFWRVTAATGMQYLRSPGVHHIDLHPYALRRFAKKGQAKRLARFVHPYERPGLELFKHHAEHVVREHRLGELRERGRALRIERREHGYRVETDGGALDARRVLLALGLAEQTCVPAWAKNSACIQHVFAPDFRRDEILATARVAIVGGGISAAQLACSLAERGVEVVVVARHPMRLHRFDSDPGWLGPKEMQRFQRTADWESRRAMIAGARHRGSIPPEIGTELKRKLSRGVLRWLEADVVNAESSQHAVELRLDRAPWSLTVDRVVLSTGFDAHRPGGELLSDEAIDRLGLPCAACGYPVVSPRLEWGPGLFVTGPLAELELGPTARNIAGARAAAERVLSAA